VTVRRAGPGSGNAAIVARLFFENARLFFKNAWHFKNIFREFETFLNISILFEDIFREIEAYFNLCEGFSKIARLFIYIFSGREMEAFSNKTF
jgi:hypothetical protein